MFDYCTNFETKRTGNTQLARLAVDGELEAAATLRQLHAAEIWHVWLAFGVHVHVARGAFHALNISDVFLSSSLHYFYYLVKNAVEQCATMIAECRRAVRVRFPFVIRVWILCSWSLVGVMKTI